MATLIVGAPYVFFFLEKGLFDFELLSFSFKILLFALFAGFLFTLEQRRLEDKGIAAEDTNTDLIGVTQRRRVRSTIPPHELLDTLRDHERIASFKPKQKGDLIRLQNSTSWFSWGEKMSVRLIEVMANGYEYEVVSKATMPLTLVDYGRNLENVLLIGDVLQKPVQNTAELELPQLDRFKIDAPLDREDLYL